MAKFCEDCPLRGRAIGELEAAGFMPVEGGYTDFLSGEPVTTYRELLGVVLDEHRNPSKPIRKAAETTDTLLDKIEACEEPKVVEVPRLFRKPKLVKTCPAIGRLAVKPGTKEYWLVAKEVAL